MQKEHLKNVALSKIKPYSRNPRKNDKAVDYVCKSIQKNGYIAPILTDEEFCILAGHTRFLALKKLKYKECDIIKISGLTEKQKKDYRIRDNKSSELAEWDFETLQIDFKPLELEDFGFDLQTDFATDFQQKNNEINNLQNLSNSFNNCNVKTKKHYWIILQFDDENEYNFVANKICLENKRDIDKKKLLKLLKNENK